MWLVAELFETLPEAGDLPKPKLVFFFDEAHLLFNGATKAFVDSVEQTVRLIRSKGVGVFFVTQTPKDLPEGVLAQLGNRVQHALRAFTPDDAKDLRATVSTFPTSDFYDLGELLPQMGIGEAAVTILSENGVPTPVVHTKLRAPASRMAPADDVEGAAKASPLWARYGTRIDADSAREQLAARVDAFPSRGYVDVAASPGPPVYRPPVVDASLPLTLISPSSDKAITSQLFELTPEKSARVTLGPVEAAQRNLRDGDHVRLYNSFGEVLAILSVSDELPPGVAALPKGLWLRSTLNGRTSNALQFPTT